MPSNGKWKHLKVNYGGDGATALEHQDTLRFIQSKTKFHDKTKDYSITLIKKGRSLTFQGTTCSFGKLW